MSAAPIRTRFAPSPTGLLQIGNTRTALFAWLAAKSTGGAFVLRIEDTDRERYIPGGEAQIYEALMWLGMEWDEGPDVGGPHAPYVQSERLPLYLEHANLLAEKGAAYWCTCTPERLTEMRAAQQANHQATRYDRHCLNRQEEVAKERAAGTVAVLRQRMPEGRAEWDDVVGGHLSFDYADIDDSVLLKSDGFPTYHLAVVVDDHAMEITHVIRSVEWVPSTPKHLALFEAFGWTPPKFAHVPNVLAEDGKKKLSKRDGARFVLEYGELGYLPSAMVNAMALMGWSSESGKEFFLPDELVAAFSLEEVHNSPAVFDPKRLDNINGLHIRAMPTEELIEQLEFHLPHTSKETRRQLIPMLRERMVTLRDAATLAAPLLGGAEWNTDVAFPPKNVDAETANGLLEECIRDIEANGVDDIDGLRERLTAWLDARGMKARDGFRVLYVAILGRPAGVPVFDAMQFLETDESLFRLRAAQRKLSSAAV